MVAKKSDSAVGSFHPEAVFTDTNVLSMVQNFINDIFVMIFTHFDQMIQMNKFALSLVMQNMYVNGFKKNY